MVSLWRRSRVQDVVVEVIEKVRNVGGPFESLTWKLSVSWGFCRLREKVESCLAVKYIR